MITPQKYSLEHLGNRVHVIAGVSDFISTGKRLSLAPGFSRVDRGTGSFEPLQRFGSVEKPLKRLRREGQRFHPAEAGC